MFVRCGVILIVRVFFHIFTSLATITTPSLHPDAITLAVGAVQEGLGVSLDQSERCERVCRRSANDSQRGTLSLLFLFEGRSAMTIRHKYELYFFFQVRQKISVWRANLNLLQTLCLHLMTEVTSILKDLLKPWSVSKGFSSYLIISTS